MPMSLAMGLVKDDVLNRTLVDAGGCPYVAALLLHVKSVVVAVVVAVVDVVVAVTKTAVIGLVTKTMSRGGDELKGGEAETA